MINSHALDKKLLMILGPLMLLAPLTVDIYIPFMPGLTNEFQATAAAIQMTITWPLMVMGLGQIFWGVISDKIGRSQALYVNLSLYLLASVGCYYLTSIEAFIATRILQAFAVCGCQVMTLALVRDLTEGEQTQRLFSRLLGISGTAPIFAPYLGTLLSELSGSWRAIFIFLGVYTALAIVQLSQIPASHQVVSQVPSNQRKVDTFNLSSFTKEVARITCEPSFRRWSIVPIFIMIALFIFVAMSTHYLQSHKGFDKHTYALILAVNALFFFSRLICSIADQPVVWCQKNYHSGLTCDSSYSAGAIILLSFF
jgi:DHA1 family bicyclomycin/chloramphenicol resistance-like MFS transporter